MVFNTYHHTRTCLDEKIEIDEKKFQKFFSLPISLRVTLKLSLRSRFSAKKHFFVFCRKFGFNVEKLSNHYSQLKKQVKVDPETRSYDFLTKTREKNPRSPNILILGMTLGFHLNINKGNSKQNSKIQKNVIFFCSGCSTSLEMDQEHSEDVSNNLSDHKTSFFRF